jgi:hypothetical protein
MDAREVVLHEVDREGRLVVVELLAEGRWSGA